MRGRGGEWDVQQGRGGEVGQAAGEGEKVFVCLVCGMYFQVGGATARGGGVGGGRGWVQGGRCAGQPWLVVGGWVGAVAGGGWVGDCLSSVWQVLPAGRGSSSGPGGGGVNNPRVA